MTDVLGYDICGRPLRAGDTVETLRDSPWGYPAGSRFGVTDIPVAAHNKGKANGAAKVVLNEDMPHGIACDTASLRKIDRPATDAFTEWFRSRMDHVHREPSPQYEREIRDAMPWTGGE